MKRTPSSYQRVAQDEEAAFCARAKAFPSDKICRRRTWKGKESFFSRCSTLSTSLSIAFLSAATAAGADAFCFFHPRKRTAVESFRPPTSEPFLLRPKEEASFVAAAAAARCYIVLLNEGRPYFN